MGLFRKNQPQKQPVPLTDYPTNLCVQTESGHWYINGKFKHKFPSHRVLNSWSFANIIPSTDDLLKKYRTGKAMGFRDGTLVRSIETSKFYFISKREKRLVTNPDFVEAFGVTFENTRWASEKELALHADGEVI